MRTFESLRMCTEGGHARQRLPLKRRHAVDCTLLLHLTIVSCGVLLRAKSCFCHTTPARKPVWRTAFHTHSVLMPHVVAWLLSS